MTRISPAEFDTLGLVEGPGMRDRIATTEARLEGVILGQNPPEIAY